MVKRTTTPPKSQQAQQNDATNLSSPTVTNQMKHEGDVTPNSNTNGNDKNHDNNNNNNNPEEIDYVYELNENDVLCVQHRRWIHHTGNQLYRREIMKHVKDYDQGNKENTTFFTKKIVSYMKKEYNSRFLCPVVDNKTKQQYAWKIISEAKARDKTSHAFRFALQRALNNAAPDMSTTTAITTTTISATSETVAVGEISFIPKKKNKVSQKPKVVRQQPPPSNGVLSTPINTSVPLCVTNSHTTATPIGSSNSQESDYHHYNDGPTNITLLTSQLSLDPHEITEQKQQSQPNRTGNLTSNGDNNTNRDNNEEEEDYDDEVITKDAKLLFARQQELLTQMREQPKQPMTKNKNSSSIPTNHLSPKPPKQRSPVQQQSPKLLLPPLPPQHQQQEQRSPKQQPQLCTKQEQCQMQQKDILQQQKPAQYPQQQHYPQLNPQQQQGGVIEDGYQPQIRTSNSAGIRLSTSESKEQHPSSNHQYHHHYLPIHHPYDTDPLRVVDPLYDNYHCVLDHHCNGYTFDDDDFEIFRLLHF